MGETGSYPMMIEMMKLSVKYFKRVMSLPPTQLVKAAMTEQVNLNLPWYSGIESIIQCFENIDPRTYTRNSSSRLNATSFADSCNPDKLTSNFQKQFTDAWRSKIEESRKLSFYKGVKTVFAWEPYLDHARTFDDRRSTAQIRCSSHKLSIETGRYDNTPLEKRTCLFCKLNGSLQLIEDENHLLTFCPLGNDLRDKFMRISGNMVNSNSTVSTDFARIGIVRAPDQYDNLSLQDVNLIKISCSTINEMYRLNLHFKGSLLDNDKK